MYHRQSNSFSMLFAMGNGHRGGYDDAGDMYSSSYTTSAAPSASVDCTLSLGTPSTHLSNENNIQNHHQYEKKRSSCMSNFGWNILPSSKQTPPSSAVKGHRGGNGNCNSSGGGGDPLLARRCANCDTTSTPLWRNGPRGPKSLCNACGIRYKKEERRATAAAASSNVGGGAHGSHVVDAAQYSGGSSWGGGHHQPEKTPCYSSANYGNEYRFMEDDVVVDHRDAEIPFMSWRFNVTDRTGLVHDFTR